MDAVFAIANGSAIARHRVTRAVVARSRIGQLAGVTYEDYDSRCTDDCSCGGCSSGHDDEYVSRAACRVGFRYEGDTEVYVGVIAQQVARFMPGTVVRGDDGYLRVDYDRWA